jgi:hypothetical protein
MMTDKDSKPKNTSDKVSDQEADKNKTKQETEDTKDPHRGITNTPSQEKEMMPGGIDPEDYFDEDGALDEELEDLDDEVDE